MKLLCLNFHTNWLLFLKVMQKNKSGCFLLNTVYLNYQNFISISICRELVWIIADRPNSVIKCQIYRV